MPSSSRSNSIRRRGIIFVEQLADASDVDAASHQLGADLKGARGRVRILKRAGVGRDRDEKIFRDGAESIGNCWLLISSKRIWPVAGEIGSM